MIIWKCSWAGTIADMIWWWIKSSFGHQVLAAHMEYGTPNRSKRYYRAVGPSSGVSMAAKIPGVHTQKLVKHTTFGHKWWVHELLTDWCHIFWNGIWNLFTFNSLSKHFVALSKNSPFPLSLQWSEKPTWHGTMSDSVWCSWHITSFTYPYVSFLLSFRVRWRQLHFYSRLLSLEFFL
jgi:hypothetical protein